jgi:hypothetical protein
MSWYVGKRTPSTQPMLLISLTVVGPLQTPLCCPAPLKEWLRRLEPYAGKLARTVLRGGDGRKVILLPDHLGAYAERGKPVVLPSGRRAVR